MKATEFMMAFVVSAAIHAGAVSSNLLHVSAEDTREDRSPSIRLHVAPAVMHAPSRVPAKTEEKSSSRSEPEGSPIAEFSGSLNEAAPAAGIPDVEPLKHDGKNAFEDPPNVEPPVYQFQCDVPDSVQDYMQVARLLRPEALLQEKEPPGKPVRPLTVSHKTLPPNPQPARDDASRRAGKTRNPESPARTAHTMATTGESTEKPDVGVTRPASIHGLSKPGYPRYSRIHEEEGSTILSVEIQADGSLGKVEIVQSSGYRRLDAAAVEAVRKADFIPARKAGRTVTSRERIVFRFDLEDWE